MAPLRSRRFLRWWLALGVLVVVVSAAAVFSSRNRAPSAANLLEQAGAAALNDDRESAIRLARLAAGENPKSAAPWLMIAELSQESGDLSGAVTAWEQIPLEFPEAAPARLRAAHACLRELRQLGHAERLFRQVLKRQPDNATAIDGLAQTQAIAGNRTELTDNLIHLIELDASSNFHLDLLARGGDLNVDPQMIPTKDQIASDDWTSQCAHARLALQSGEARQARDELESLLKQNADYIPAKLLLGRVLLALKSDSDLQRWLRDAPPDVRGHVEFWQVALGATGRWKDSAGQQRCAWEVLSRDPNDTAACLVLGQGLQQSGDSESAKLCLERAQRLERYVTLVSSARKPGNWVAVEEAVSVAEELGLVWEAWGWSHLAMRLNATLKWPQPVLARLQPRLARLGRNRTDPAMNPMRKIDPSGLALPRFDIVPSETIPPVVAASQSVLRFEEATSTSGLEFTYHNGGDSLKTGLRRMFEFTGGGVGCLDYDGDGAPDLYFPEGGDFASRGKQMSVTDRLFRNVSGHGWSDVTAQAGFLDEGFGQGICAGDLDNDGFPDLLVLNIGRNVLWRNNGDGTFQRWQEFENFAGDSWSTSAAIADLDGDANPDIYVVNYLMGDDVFSRVCPDSQGVLSQSCHPLIFPAAPDVLLRSLGNGEFEDSTASSGIDRPEGRGMGVVVGRMTQPDSLDVFVANDATANFHFVREKPAAGSSPLLSFADEAFARGTAVDGAGQGQASMGVAAEDANGDGHLDLFVTNFEAETNAFYLNSPAGIFSDESGGTHLAEPGRPLLGFGTQFLDADLDGAPEIVVANGHVTNRRDSGSLYQMPPQLFRNLGGNAFQLVEPHEAGTYFAGQFLGRGLAVLDWNDDGKPDFAVSHLDRPAALLTNQSQGCGHWLKVRLVGTISARDPIGAKVTVISGNRRLVRQLTAGNGFESTNEPVLNFGLGDTSPSALSLKVEWPSGTTTEVAGVSVDRQFVIIEGRPTAVPLAGRD